MDSVIAIGFAMLTGEASALWTEDFERPNFSAAFLIDAPVTLMYCIASANLP